MFKRQGGEEGGRQQMAKFDHNDSDEDEPETKESLKKHLKAKEAEMRLLEIDLRSFKSQVKILQDKGAALEATKKTLLGRIEQLEVKGEKMQVEQGFLQEQLAEAKLFIVKLQELLDLKGAAERVRVRCWDVFKELYTMPAESEEMVFTQKELGDEGAQLLSETLEVFTQLKRLNLAENGIGRRGVDCLSVQLSINESIQDIDLRDNHLADDAAPAFATIFVGGSLKSAHLARNRIGCDGLAVLSSGLADARCQLTSLNLGNNKIAAKGAKSLGQALCKNQSLKFLSLAGNELGDFGITNLAHMLRLNDTLTELNVAENDIRQAGVAELLSCLFENEALQTLRLNGNDKMDDEAKKALAALRNSSRKDFRLYF